MKPRPKAYSYVRFSTPEQLKGDSRRRQFQLSKDYAAAHNLDLAEETFQDFGVSAFRGKNVKEGEFAAFLAAIDEGKIKPGSYLLVESLDRISRDAPYRAFRQFSEIIEKGIKIVTLTDQQEYSAETLADKDNMGSMRLFGSIMVMSRAHDESLMKSKRLSASWSQRRKNAATQPITTVGPAWLEWKDGEWYVDKKRAELIEEIFRLKVSGRGKYQIQRILNNRKEPPWNESRRKSRYDKRPSFWHYSYIGRILVNRQVLGEFHPHEKTNGRRIPYGLNPIKHYYPQIITEKLFLAAQGTGGKKGGRPSSKEKNLFTHFAYCHCGSPMHFADKGEGYRYLVCSQARSGRGCRYVNWRYSDFELSFVTWVKAIPLAMMFNAQSEAKLSALRKAVDELRGQKLESDKICKRLLNIAKTDDNPPMGLLSELKAAEADKNDVIKNLEAKELELIREQENCIHYERDASRLLNLTKKLQDIEARTRFKQELARRIERIVMYPDKAPVNSPLREMLSDAINATNASSGIPVASVDGDGGEFPKQDVKVINNPLYRVFFRDGSIWNVIPNPEAPDKILFMLTQGGALDDEILSSTTELERVSEVMPEDAKKSLAQGIAVAEEIRQQVYAQMSQAASK